MSIDQPMPLDYIRLCLEKNVKVQLTDDRELSGLLHAYDEHCNLIMDKIVETISYRNQSGEIVKQTRNLDLLYIRGDRVITISPI